MRSPCLLKKNFSFSQGIDNEKFQAINKKAKEEENLRIEVENKLRIAEAKLRAIESSGQKESEEAIRTRFAVSTLLIIFPQNRAGDKNQRNW